MNKKQFQRNEKNLTFFVPGPTLFRFFFFVGSKPEISLRLWFRIWPEIFGFLDWIQLISTEDKTCQKQSSCSDERKSETSRRWPGLWTAAAATNEQLSRNKRPKEQQDEVGGGEENMQQRRWSESATFVGGRSTSTSSLPSTSKFPSLSLTYKYKREWEIERAMQKWESVCEDLWQINGQTDWTSLVRHLLSWQKRERGEVREGEKESDCGGVFFFSFSTFFG